MDKKINKILKSKSGISLVFVLSVTLFLLAMGASTLVAASTAAGASSKQLAFKQMELYSDSLIRTISFQLCNLYAGAENSPNATKSLARELIYTMYESEHDGESLPEQLRLTIQDPENMRARFDLDPLSIDYDPLHVKIIPPVPAMPEITNETEDGQAVVLSPATESQPEKAYIDANVSIVMNVKKDKEHLKSKIIYEVTNGYLEDGKIILPGNWRLISYERLD